MTDVRISLAVVGVTGELPPPVPLGDSVDVRITAVDAVSGAAVAATGVTLRVAQPSGEVATYTAAEMTAGAAGIWTKSLLLDVAGKWLARPAATGPVAAVGHDLPLTVSPSDTATIPIPATVRGAADVVAAAVAAGAALIASALTPALAITRDPLATDDAAAGGRALAVILNLDSATVHDCLDATNGAARWMRRGVSPMLPRQAGLGLIYSAPGIALSTAAPVAGVLYLRKVMCWERGALMAVLVRSSAAANSAPNAGFKASVFADHGGRPSALLSQDTVGMALGVTALAWSSPQSLTPWPGPLWVGMEFTAQFTGAAASVLPPIVGFHGDDYSAEAEIGVAALDNNLALQGFQVAKTWAATMPVFTTADDWTTRELRGNGMPMPRLRFA